MNEILQQKKATTQYPVADFITKRFSPRAYSTKPISDHDLQTLFESASWSASSSNLQPWFYIYAHRGSELFQTLLECLNPSNQVWAKDAAVLVLSMVRGKTPDDKPGAFALYDLGMATATMMLQAQTMSIYGRQMGGYKRDLVREKLAVPENIELGVVIALGYLGTLEGRDPDFVRREQSIRERRAVASFAMNSNPFVGLVREQTKGSS